MPKKLTLMGLLLLSLVLGGCGPPEGAAANPTMHAIMTLGQAMAWMAGIVALLGLGMVVLIDLWGKHAVQDRIYGIFLDNRSLFSKLLKTEGNKAFLGRGEHKEEYLLDVDKQFWAWWPAGLPKILQIPVRAHWYIRNQSEPIDPQNQEATLSAKARMMISDEALLKSTWKDVREATLGPVPISQNKGLAIVFLLINLGLTGFILYLVMNISKTVGA